MTYYDLWLNLESDKKTCPWKEIEKSLFLITVERPKLVTEEGAEVFIKRRLIRGTLQFTEEINFISALLPLISYK
ncbi:hypothetical protein K7X08_032139 [Anisodus acutangulus]|uniref:Uncharacterized protein n=1 Tax=Anisodus acutangulus TaxID=402998 RepID=A0A9Q1RMC9_9SOLA|nr:hypothetical protein K7X08_032139 [Anisodus acutangulus]